MSDEHREPIVVTSLEQLQKALRTGARITQTDEADQIDGFSIVLPAGSRINFPTNFKVTFPGKIRSFGPVVPPEVDIVTPSESL
jgi:hypothetical protein